MHARRHRFVPVVFSLLAVASVFVAAQTQPVSPSLYAGMRWRLIGPFRGGRALAVAGVRGQPDVFYFGAVAGAVWKTTNAGRTWTPIFDTQPIASIGALAVAPSDANAIYAGSGEADMRSDITFGNGVYKSTDAGRTWRHLGLDDTQQIGRILVDPQNPDIVLVAALGHAYGPNAERGVFRSTDGGQHWSKVLFKDDRTGAVDLAADPDSFATIYAALWNVHRPAWDTYAPITGPGGGLYRSTDGGVTWTELTGHGLPAGPFGRVGLALAAGQNGRRVYALIDAERDPGLYRSDDGGDSWRLVGTDPRVRGRAWYFGGVTVDPRNPDVVYIPNVALWRSTDGGATFVAIKGAPGGDDYHALWVDPDHPARMIVGSDQGTVVSVDGGDTWTTWYNQPTAQFYHVATDNRFPYRVYGAQQDSGTVGILSRGKDGAITFRDWTPVGGGESGFILPDPVNADTVFGGSTSGQLFRFDRATGQVQNISPVPVEDFGRDLAELRYRFPWTSAMAFAPRPPHALYYGAQVVLETLDGGRSWRTISPDLTKRSGRSAEVARGEGEERAVISTIAPSPVRPGLIWVGTDNGLIQVTGDNGRTWRDVTPEGLPAWSRISLLDASPHDAATAYAAVDRHQVDDDKPYIYRTQDAGRTWALVAAGIDAPAFVRAVREDPVRKGLLFAGTELGVYMSLDAGGHWAPLQLNLPVAPVHDLVVHGDDLVVATHGRSFWILDDITPLRQIDAKTATADVLLFRPQVAYRVRSNMNTDTPLPPEEPAGQNPPDGAIIDYWLRGSEDPRLRGSGAGPVTLDILDAAGTLVRHYASTDQPEAPVAGRNIADDWIRPPQVLSADTAMHRFVWDLRYSMPAALQFGYPMTAVVRDTPRQPRGVWALPGRYTVKLTVDGRSYTQPLELKLDPRVKTPPAGLLQQFTLGRRIDDLLRQDYEALQAVRALRGQLRERQQGGGATGLADAISALDRQAATIEGGGQGPGLQPGLAQLNGRLVTLLTIVNGADVAPTTQVVAAVSEARKALASLVARWDGVKAKDLVALNEKLRQAGLPPMTVK